MRVFVAVPVVGEPAAIVAAWLERLDMPGRLVPVENWHLTLRFVGDVDDVAYDRLLASVEEAVAEVDAFEVVLGGVGGFPNTANATVSFLEVASGADQLTELAHVVDAAVDRVGLGLEERPYHPHLTLARIRPPADLRPVSGAGGALGLHLPVGDVVVYRSRRGPGGARYEPLTGWRLA